MFAPIQLSAHYSPGDDHGAVLVGLLISGHQGGEAENLGGREREGEINNTFRGNDGIHFKY